MHDLKCKSCGSVSLQKSGNGYICQHCGTIQMPDIVNNYYDQQTYNIYGKGADTIDDREIYPSIYLSKTRNYDYPDQELARERARRACEENQAFMDSIRARRKSEPAPTPAKRDTRLGCAILGIIIAILAVGGIITASTGIGTGYESASFVDSAWHPDPNATPGPFICSTGGVWHICDSAELTGIPPVATSTIEPVPTNTPQYDCNPKIRSCAIIVNNTNSDLWVAFTSVSNRDDAFSVSVPANSSAITLAEAGTFKYVIIKGHVNPIGEGEVAFAMGGQTWVLPVQ